MVGESGQATAERPRTQDEQLTGSPARSERVVVRESATAAVLREIEADGWTVLHRVRWPGRRFARVDHVVIGNGQVYVIDSKSVTGSVTVTGGVLRQNGRPRQKYVTRVAEMAKAVASLAPALPPSTVHPVLCLVRDEWVSERFGDVLVCSTQNLVALLEHQQQESHGPAYQHKDLVHQLEDALKSQAAPAGQVPKTMRAPKAAKVKRPKWVRSTVTSKAAKGTAVGVVLALGVASLLFNPGVVTSITDPVVENVSNFLSPGSDQPADEVTKKKKPGKKKGQKAKNKQQQTQQ